MLTSEKMGFLGKNVLALAFFLLLFSEASAFISELPGTVTVKGIPTEFYFKVTNDDIVDRPLEVEVLAPAETEFLEQPGIVGAGRTERVTVRVFPESTLNGKEITATVSAKLGKRAAEKNFKISFERALSCPVSIDLSLNKSQENGEKLFVVAALKNSSVSSEEVELAKISGLPESWGIELPNAVSVGRLEQKNLTVTITPNSAFEGEAELLFKCGNFIEKRSLDVSAGSEGNNFFSGLTSLFSFEQLNRPFEFSELELLLDIALVLIAAVLLIAFIARFVRKIGGEKPAKPETNTASVQRHEVRAGRPRDKFETYNPRLEELKERIQGKK